MIQNKKKVLHFTRKDLQLHASFIQNQINHHQEFLPHVVYLEKRSTAQDYVYATDIHPHIPVFHLFHNSNALEQCLYKFTKITSQKRKNFLLEYVHQLQPDVLHFHYGTDAGLYLPTLKSLSIPKIVSFYGYECSGFPKRFYGFGRKYLQRYVFKYADLVFAMSEDMKLDLLASGCPPDKIFIHYYGTDVHRFHVEQSYNQDTTIRFLMISGFTPQKGHHFLLKAFAEATQQNSRIHLTLVGSGQAEAEIRYQIQKLGISEFVTMAGPVKYASPQHITCLSKHDVFIHPSVTDKKGNKEGIPGAIVEAMASGLPVISTFHAGIPHVIENERTGFLVKENDVNALSKLILRVAKEPELRENVGKAAQAFALSHLDLGRKEQELEYVYNSLLKRNR